MILSNMYNIARVKDTKNSKFLLKTKIISRPMNKHQFNYKFFVLVIK